MPLLTFGTARRSTFAAALLFATPTAAGAQTVAAPNTVTPPTLRPDLPPAAAAFSVPEAQGLTPPPGAEALHVAPGSVLVEGAFPRVREEVAALARAAEHRDVSLAQLYALASAIEAAHARAGYVLARATIPPQQLNDGGAVRITIVDGFVETVDTAALVGRREVTLAVLERQVLLAGEVAGVSLRSTLARGEQAGGVRLIVEGTWRPLRASVRADNAIDRSLADANATLQIGVNGLLGLGETVYGYLGTDDPLHPFAARTRVSVYGGGVLFGVGDGRLTLNPEATVSRTRPAPVPGVPLTRGLFTRIALRGGYLLGATRSGRSALDLSVEAIDQRNTAIEFATDLARDRYAVARVGATVSRVLPRASWSLAAQLGQGLGDLAHAGTSLTRQGATARFTKVTAQARSALALGTRWSLSGVALGQTSFDRAQLRAEQFQLEGVDAVSAYVGGATTVDEGATVRVELARRLAIGRVPLSPYLFGAGGVGRIARPTAVEPDELTAAAIGVGARIGLFGGRAELTAEYARGWSSLAALNHRDRVNFSSRIAF